MGLADRINKRRNLGLREKRKKKRESEKERDTPRARSQAVTSQTERAGCSGSHFLLLVAAWVSSSLFLSILTLDRTEVS